MRRAVVDVMVTVPANKLIAPITDRIPAILEDADWNTWLGANDATAEQAQTVLKPMEGVSWKAEPEPKKSRPTKPAKPTPPN
jgi:putative SOS response-associated peptidase YedK